MMLKFTLIVLILSIFTLNGIVKGDEDEDETVTDNTELEQPILQKVKF